MHGIVQGFGLIVIVIGVLVGLVGLSAGLAGLLMGAYIVISGAVLFCFGTMVEHLAAIRKMQGEMLMEFRNMVQWSKDRAVPAPRQPAPPRAPTVEASGQRWPD